MALLLITGCNKTGGGSSYEDSSESTSINDSSSEEISEESSEDSSSEDSSSEDSSEEEIKEILDYVEAEDKHTYTDAVYNLNDLTVKASRSENYHFVVKLDGEMDKSYKYNFVFDLSSLAVSSYSNQTYAVSVNLFDSTYECYYLDGSNQLFDKTLVEVKANDNTLYLNILLNELDDEFDTSSVRFVTFLEDIDSRSIISPTSLDNPIDVSNPSTFTYVTTSNEIVKPEFNIYDIDSDVTLYKNLGVFKQDLYHRDINVDIYRNNNEKLLIKLTHDFISWNKNTRIKIYLDGDDYFSSIYQDTSYVLEVNPSLVKVDSFINVLTGNSITEGCDISAKNNVVLISIDLTKLENIKDKDIGVGGYTVNTGSLTELTYYNDKEYILNNVSSYVRISALNELKYVDPSIYDSTYDNNQYIDLEITIAGSINNGVTLGNTDVKLARNGKYLYALFTTSDAEWNQNAACWLYLDGGAADKTVRDEDSYSIRLVASPASVKNYFRIAGNVALNNSKISVRSNATQLFACIDLTEMDETYATKDIGVATCTANNANSQVMMVNTYKSSRVSLTNPSTFLRISKDNEILTDLEDVSIGSYKENADTTPYINDEIETIPASGASQAMNVEFSRTGTIVTIRCKLTGASLWDAKQRIWVYIECSNPYASTRTTGHTSSMRINPTTETLLQYFIISPNTALNLSSATIKSNNVYCYISFDITAINSSYSTGDVAVIVGAAYSSTDSATNVGTWKTSGYYKSTTQVSTAKPIDWVHLTSTNTIGVNS